MSGDKTGRPGSATTPPPEARVAEVKAPGVRLDSQEVIGRPIPVVDSQKISPAEKPEKAAAQEEKELGWSRIEIDLGSSTDHIKINGQAFYQGHTYTVRNDLVAVLMDVMYSTKMHEAVINGRASPTGKRLQVGARF